MRWLPIILVAALLAGCGGGTTSSDTGGDTTSTESVSTADVNQRIAARFASFNGGKNLADICSRISVIGMQQTVQLGEKQLGPTIIKEGGDVSEVVRLMLQRC